MPPTVRDEVPDFHGSDELLVASIAGLTLRRVYDRPFRGLRNPPMVRRVPTTPRMEALP